MILTYSIGIAFIVASMAVTYGLDKKSLFDPYIDMLTPEEKNRCDAIVKERRRIYLTGFSLGLIVPPKIWKCPLKTSEDSMTHISAKFSTTHILS